MPYLLSCAVGAAFVIVFVVQIKRIATGYGLSTGTRWQKFLAAFSYSHTILLSRVASFLAAASVFIVNFLPALDPTSPLGNAVLAALNPKYSTYYALAFALIVEIVRKLPSATTPILPPPQAVVIPPAPVIPDVAGTV